MSLRLFWKRRKNKPGLERTQDIDRLLLCGGGMMRYIVKYMGAGATHDLMMAAWLSGVGFIGFVLLLG